MRVRARTGITRRARNHRSKAENTSARKAALPMEPTITLEFTSDTRRHLHELEHQLKQIHGVTVYYVEPRDNSAPVLISLGLSKKGEQANLEARRVAHTLYDFLHDSERDGQKSITLVTIEGESIDIAPLAEEEIREIVNRAYAEQP